MSRNIFVKVYPKSKNTKVEKIKEGTYKVRVQVAPEKGKANKALIEALAEYFGVPQSSIKIIKGSSAREKVLEI